MYTCTCYANVHVDDNLQFDLFCIDMHFIVLEYSSSVRFHLISGARR